MTYAELIARVRLEYSEDSSEVFSNEKIINLANEYLTNYVNPGKLFKKLVSFTTSDTTEQTILKLDEVNLPLDFIEADYILLNKFEIKKCAELEAQFFKELEQNKYYIRGDKLGFTFKVKNTDNIVVLSYYNDHPELTDQGETNILKTDMNNFTNCIIFGTASYIARIDQDIALAEYYATKANSALTRAIMQKRILNTGQMKMKKLKWNNYR